MNISHFDSAEQSTDYLANQIINKMTDAIDERGQAVLLVSGGRSPIALFNRLSQTDLPWHKVVVSLVDDRWVSANHPDSNEQLVKQHLLIDKAASARFIGLVNQTESAFDGVEQSILAIEYIDIIDVMILGMGEDGHTASIFPCSEQVNWAMSPDNKQRLVATKPASAPFERISFTLNEILAAKQVYLPLNGSKKVAVFEQAKQIADKKSMPISAVIAQHPALDVLISQ